MLSGESEHLGKCKVLSVDDAKNSARLYGNQSKEFDKAVIEKQDTQFCDLMLVTFGWKLQSNGDRKLVSKLPNGKILFPDKSEDTTSIEPGIPYICLVYERKDEYDDKGALIKKGREAFAKIVAEDYSPKIYVLPSRMVSLVHRDKKGKVVKRVPVHNSFEPRIMEALKIAEEELGVSSVKIVFRKNQLP